MPPIPPTSGRPSGTGTGSSKGASRSFADHAIGFYLQLEDSLTPSLKTAGTSYRKFVKDLDTWNRKAERSVGSAMARLSKLVDAFGDLPAVAAASYAKAISGLKRNIKPIRQPIEMVFGGGGRGAKSLVGMLANAIRQALERSKLTLRPRSPARRALGFDQTTALKDYYRGQVQPPDFVGAFKVPKFHQGGIVGGQKAGKEVIAKLETGEMVLTRKATQQLLKSAMGASSDAPDQIAAAVEQLYSSLSLLRQAEAQIAKTAADPKAIAAYEAQLQKVEASFVNINRESKMLGKIERDLLLEPLVGMTNTLGDYVTEVEDAVDATKALALVTQKVAGSVSTIAQNVKFMSAVSALKNIGGAFRNIHREASEAFGVDALGSYWDQMNEVNKTLHLSRSELAAFRKEAVAANRATRGVVDPTELGGAMQALVDAGIHSRKLLVSLAPAVGAFVTGFDVSGQSAAALAKVLDVQLGMSADGVAASFATLGKIAAVTGVSTDALTVSMAENAKSMGSALTSLGKDGGRAALENMAKIQGALTDVLGDAGGQLTDLLAQAAGGSKDALIRVHQLMGSNGAASSEDLAATLASSGGPAKLLAGLQTQVALSAGGGAIGQQAFADALGATYTGAQFNTVAVNMARLDTTQTSLADITVKNADGLKTLAAAAEQTQGWFTTLRKTVSNVFSEWGGDAIIGAFKELNPIVLLSVAHLAQMLGVFRLFAAAPAAAAMAPVLVALPAIGTAAASATAPVLGFGAALSAAIWPITLIAAAIAVVVGLVIYFRKELGAFFSGVWSGFLETLAPMGVALDKAFSSVKETLAPVLAFLAPIMMYIGELFDKFTGGADASASTLDKFTKAGAVFIKVLLTPLVVGFQLLGGLIGIVANLFRGDFMGALESFADMGKDIASWVLSIAGLDFDTVAASIRKFFMSIGTSIIDYVLGPINALIKGINYVSSWAGIPGIPTIANPLSVSAAPAAGASPTAPDISALDTSPGFNPMATFDTAEMAGQQKKTNELLQAVVNGQRTQGGPVGPTRAVDPMVQGLAGGAN